MKLITILFLYILASCSVKSENNVNKKVLIETISEAQDSDADLVLDLKDKELGRNPYIANFPEMKLSFFQDYKLDIKFDDNSAMIIDRTIEINNTSLYPEVIEEYFYNKLNGHLLVHLCPGTFIPAEISL